MEPVHQKVKSCSEQSSVVVKAIYKPNRQFSSPWAPAKWEFCPSSLWCFQGLSLLSRAARWISCGRLTNKKSSVSVELLEHKCSCEFESLTAGFLVSSRMSAPANKRANIQFVAHANGSTLRPVGPKEELGSDSILQREQPYSCHCGALPDVDKRTSRAAYWLCKCCNLAKRQASSTYLVFREQVLSELTCGRSHSELWKS